MALRLPRPAHPDLPAAGRAAAERTTPELAYLQARFAALVSYGITAALLLQVRTRVLNDQLADDFRRWYPGFNQAPDPMTLAA